MSTKKAKSDCDLTSFVCRRTIRFARTEHSVSHYVSENEYHIEQFLAKPSYGQLISNDYWRKMLLFWSASVLFHPVPGRHVAEYAELPTLGNSFMRVVCRGMRYRAISHSNSTLRITRSNDPRGGIDSCNVGEAGLLNDASSPHSLHHEKQETRLIPHMKALSGIRDGPCPPAYTQGQLETVVWVALDRKEASTPLRWYL